MRPRGLRRMVAWLVAVGVLAAVFMAYTQPSLMQQLGDAIWACF
jgi:hypothetical protein